MINPWPFTRSQELSLVQKALAGDPLAYNELYMGYHDRIISAHVHSAMGQFPAKFNKTFNPNGKRYDEYSGKLFDEIFRNALKSFDIAKASTGNHPFYTHLQSEICYRALDAVEKQKEEQDKTLTSRSVTEYGYRNSGKVTNVNHDEDASRASNCYVDEGMIYDGDAVERHQSKIRAAKREALARLKGTRAGNTCQAYLKEAEKGKPVVAHLAKKLDVKTGSVYYDFGEARGAFSSDEQDAIQDLLYQAA